jgi:flavin-dependent dehydrogenase
MDYKKLMGYGDKPKKKVVKKVISSKPKVNEVLKSIKEEFGFKQSLKEGPSYEYKKDVKNIDKSYKLYGKSILDLYDKLRKKDLDREASDLLKAYKKNIVTFKKTYDKILRKLI